MALDVKRCGEPSDSSGSIQLRSPRARSGGANNGNGERKRRLSGESGTGFRKAVPRPRRAVQSGAGGVSFATRACLCTMMSNSLPAAERYYYYCVGIDVVTKRVTESNTLPTTIKTDKRTTSTPTIPTT